MSKVKIADEISSELDSKTVKNQPDQAAKVKKLVKTRSGNIVIDHFSEYMIRSSYNSLHKQDFIRDKQQIINRRKEILEIVKNLDIDTESALENFYQSCLKSEDTFVISIGSYGSTPQMDPFGKGTKVLNIDPRFSGYEVSDDGRISKLKFAYNSSIGSAQLNALLSGVELEEDDFMLLKSNKKLEKIVTSLLRMGKKLVLMDSCGLYGDLSAESQITRQNLDYLGKNFAFVCGWAIPCPLTVYSKESLSDKVFKIIRNSIADFSEGIMNSKDITLADSGMPHLFQGKVVAISYPGYSSEDGAHFALSLDMVMNFEREIEKFVTTVTDQKKPDHKDSMVSAEKPSASPIPKPDHKDSMVSAEKPSASTIPKAVKAKKTLGKDQTSNSCPII